MVWDPGGIVLDDTWLPTEGWLVQPCQELPWQTKQGSSAQAADQWSVVDFMLWCLPQGFGSACICDNDHCRLGVQLRAEQELFIDLFCRALSAVLPITTTHYFYLEVVSVIFNVRFTCDVILIGCFVFDPIRATSMWRCWTWGPLQLVWMLLYVQLSGWASQRGTRCLLSVMGLRGSTKDRWVLQHWYILLLLVINVISLPGKVTTAKRYHVYNWKLFMS